MMARKATGTFETRVLADGTDAHHLRFWAYGERESMVLHELAGCECGCGGGWDEPAARTHLGNVLSEVRLGIWEPPQPVVPGAEKESERPETYEPFSEWWLDQKVAGVIGERPIAENTEKDLRNTLRHLNAFFGTYRFAEIDEDLNLAFKAKLLRDSREQTKAMKAGADLRDRWNRPLRPLGLTMIAQILQTHKAILEAALEDHLVDYNTAAGKRMRVKPPKPRRTFLEMDELGFLVAAAADQDRAMLTEPLPEDTGATATAVAELAIEGLSTRQIAEELGCVKATVSYHLKNLGAKIERGYVGRQVICEILGYCGPRVGELQDLRIGQVRLHDPQGARFKIPDAKTETGIREVEMSPDVVTVVVAHIKRLRRLGYPTGHDDYLIPNLHGGRMTRKRVGQIIREAARLASERLAEKGLPPLPNTTAHTLRRTYISIALIGNKWDVKYVMDQVGHADSTMTMDVYAQLQKRFKRSHGVNFDRLVREACEHVKALPGVVVDLSERRARTKVPAVEPAKAVAA
jgi:integrase